MRGVRKGLLIAGIVLLILGVIISAIPATASYHFTSSNFGISTGNWVFSDPVELPGGVTIRVSWISNWDVTMGIATRVAANAFQTGATSQLQTLDYGSGKGSGFSVTIPSTGQYVVAIRVAPGIGTWTFSADVEVSVPYAYAIIGVPLLLVGLVLLILGAVLRPKAPPIPYVPYAPAQPTQPAYQSPTPYQPYPQPQPPARGQPVQYQQPPANPPAPAYWAPPVNPPVQPQGPVPTGAQGPRGFCTNCGAPIAPGMAFCGACGNKLG